MVDQYLPLWEVFVRSKRGMDHKHCGSVHAADAEQALQYARDVYTRRSEGNSIWVVEATHIVASQPDDQEAFFEPADDKVYRHATFYDVPADVKHM
ncbi:1,2-phenylacetyl-CoA epoxidase subunit B [Pseudoteredinibacter isoporae]|nr:1,2-phenylacetyl-CoA epoxidase subunit PaaB [Pseudoteredinibacter isoporae]NHO89067.1 1,2-phenylacetyl-CoA epoxidase subunit B [Pseudoteredinibacter isoporae]NIB22322.1 1,2-phenylacetyl-CoA epoxidase subunit B [Pseudoteredinibacter isoporae]